MTHPDFCNPPKAYRPSPLHCWNDRLEPKEIARQIGLLHQQGFGGYFMHSRIGLESPYLGEAWMAAIAAGIDAAQRYDLEAWFYDEDKWPSGFAGGIVPALGDAYRMKGLEACLLQADEVEDEWRHPAEGLWPEGPRALFALQLGPDRSLEGFTRLNGPPSRTTDGPFLLCQARVFPGGHEWYNCESYVDLMDPKVTRAFLACTYDAYAKRFGRAFGPEVPGIFTDEPNVLPRLFGPRPNHLSPWTPALPEAFRRAYGYDLIERLPLLYLEGPNSKQVRRDYWALVTRLFRDNFTKVLADWCREHGLLFTGHYQSEDDLVLQTLHAGAVMPHYPYQDVPGIDHLGRHVDNHLTLKQVSSVAHQMGRSRVLSEIFGVSGHSMTLADQKWMADFHFALGVNFINQHLVLYSMRGERKRDYPANISWSQPYWDDYRVFNDYAGRCSWFTQRGRFEADILLMHPIASSWQLVPGRCDGLDQGPQLEKAHALNRAFMAVHNGLLADHRDFDLGDEMIMADCARVEQATLCIGEMAYKAVVLPYMSTLAATTRELLQRFIAAGGAVYAVGSIPQDAGAERLTGCRLVPDADALLTLLSQQHPRTVSITDERGEQARRVFYHQRLDGEHHLYFLAHTDNRSHATVRLHLPVAGVVTVFDPTSGQASVLEHGAASGFTYAAARVVRSDAHGVEIEWDAPPAGSLALSIGPTADRAEGAPLAERPPVEAGARSEESAHARPAVQEAVADSGPWRHVRLDPNVLVLDTCRYALGDAPVSAEPRPVPAIRAEVLAACGRKTSTQPYMYLTGRQPSRPVPVRLEFSFTIEALPRSLALVVEQAEKMSVEINGQAATERAVNAEGVDVARAWLRDRGFDAIDILSLVKPGANTVSLTFVAAADGADVEEVYVLGDFGVWARDGGYVIGEEPPVLSAGSWVGQGYPFYCGTMRYRLDLDLDSGEGAVRLDLSNAAGSLLRVRVNGAQAATLPWRPWRVDLGPYLQPGRNAVEVDVVSTLRNAFGPLHHKDGDITFTNPGHFMVGGHWTDTYQLVPYGLLGPVYVKRCC